MLCLYFITDWSNLTDKSSNKFIHVRCEDERNQLFQIFLRAGMENHIATFLKNRGADILHSKFYIDMKLNVAPARKAEQVVAALSRNPTLNNDAMVEEGGMGLEPLIGANNRLMTNEAMNTISNKANKHNTTMAVNALQLAMLAKQPKSVKCLMNHIFSSKNEQQYSETLNAVLGAQVVLDFCGFEAEQFSKYDLCLDKMNSLHISCQYHPEAIEIIFDAIYKHKTALTNLPKLVNDKSNIMAYAPLHIAAKKSFLNVAR